MLKVALNRHTTIFVVAIFRVRSARAGHRRALQHHDVYKWSTFSGRSQDYVMECGQSDVRTCGKWDLAGHAQQHLMLLAGRQTRKQIANLPRLVAHHQLTVQAKQYI